MCHRKFSQPIFRSIILVCCVTFVVTSLTGCEPLRKKFIRKKKTEEASSVQPILEPMDYPAVVHNAQDVYAHNYSLTKIWYTDLMTEFMESKMNDKRIIYDLEQMMVNLDHMQKLLTGEKKAQLVASLEKLKGLREKMDANPEIRNNDIIKRGLSAIEKQLHNQFKPGLIENALVTEVPSDIEN